MENLLQFREAFGFFLRQLLYRNLCPRGDCGRNILFRHREFSASAPLLKTFPGTFHFFLSFRLLFLELAGFVKISVFNRLFFFCQQRFMLPLIFLQRFRNLESTELYSGRSLNIPMI